jgi:hypothetical protein
MRILFLYFSMLSVWSSYLYGSDRLILLSATQQELDDIYRDQLNKAAHANTAVTTLQSVLTKDAVSLVIDFLRPKEDNLRYYKLTKDLMDLKGREDYETCPGTTGLFSIIGIRSFRHEQNAVDITTAFIQNDPFGTCSIRQGNIVYRDATSSFSHISFIAPFCSDTMGTCLCCNRLSAGQAVEKLNNLDKQKSLSTVILSDDKTVTAVSPSKTRFICIDDSNAHLAAWLSYTQWLSSMKNQRLVKALKWNGRQT